VGKVINVFAIFPQTHTLIVMPPVIAVTHSMRITNEERSYLPLHTEIYHLSCGFVAHITDTAFSATALLVLRSLQLLPTTRILGASGLLLGDASYLHRALPLERTNAAPGDNHGFTRIGCHASKVYLSQVYCCMSHTRGLFSLRYLDTYMQFKTVVPD
jgi:hypothetical protein